MDLANTHSEYAFLHTRAEKTPNRPISPVAFVGGAAVALVLVVGGGYCCWRRRRTRTRSRAVATPAAGEGAVVELGDPGVGEASGAKLVSGVERV